MSTLPANFLDVEQGSAEWFAARCGCVTSSRVADAITKLKRSNDEAAARRNLRWEIVCELLTGNASEHYVSKWMEEGKENEPLARTAYEIAQDVIVEQVGFVYHPSISRAGASPDGLVGKDGLLEIKCPKTSTHLQYLADGQIPEEYQLQMLWQMACAERQWCDFISYDPRLPEEFQMFMSRLSRDDKRIAEMEKEVTGFLAEVQNTVTKLRSRNKAEMSLYA